MMIAFHSMMGTFTAAGIIPAFDTFAEMCNVSVPVASYLASAQVLLGTSALASLEFHWLLLQIIDCGARSVAFVLETFIPKCGGKRAAYSRFAASSCKRTRSRVRAPSN